MIEALLFTASLLSAMQAAVDRCVALDDDDARLACYDALFRPGAGTADATASPAAPEAPAPLAAAGVATPIVPPTNATAAEAPVAAAGVATEPQTPEEDFGLTEA